MKKSQSNFPHLQLKDGILKDQLYHAFREAILDGRLHPRMKLPSSRALSETMQISRNSVLQGFDRLIDEGYLLTKPGSGTYVSDTIPDELIAIPNRSDVSVQAFDSALELNPQLLEMARLRDKGNTRHSMFNIGVGCVDLFPHQLWGRLLGRVWRQSRKTQGKHSHSAGHLPLREAISDYARSTRGLNCTPEQIIIVNGTQQAINLTAQVLLQQGDEVWLDEPGYDGALGAFLSQNLQVRPVSLDDEGTKIAEAIQQWPSVKLAFTAPSHQFPLGGTLSLPRRLALLDWAAEQNKWILEDDYNSEFRYSARPIQALQGLDKQQRVIYAGTFSKMLLPELRLGFLVVPPKLVDAFNLAKHYADSHTAYLEQATLALFIAEGHYARHVRRVRKACLARQTALITAIEQYLPDKLSVQTSDSGIHLVCWLKGGLTEDEVINKCRQLSLGAQPLSRYCQAPYPRQAILLGYAAHTPDELRENIKNLAQVL